MVVYDFGMVNFVDGVDLFIVVINNVGIGDLLVILLVVDGDGSFKIWDVEVGVVICVVYGISDVLVVDVVVNNEIVLVDGI